MDAIYVFKHAPSSIKRLIYIYLIGLGTPTSTLIKDEYDKLYEANKNNIIVNEHMSYYIDRDIGFMGCRMSSKTVDKRIHNYELHKRYTGNIGTKIIEDWLLSKQIYEIDSAKSFYLYNYTNVQKFYIIMAINGDNSCLEKLFKYKYLQLKNEE